MKNSTLLSKKTSILLLILFVPFLLLSCGKASSDTDDTGGISGLPGGTSVEKTIGTFVVKADKTSVNANEDAIITITPSTAAKYGCGFSASSNSTLKVDNTFSGKNINLNTGETTGVKTYSLKGTTSGQIINLAVSITGNADKAVFTITVK